MYISKNYCTFAVAKDLNPRQAAAGLSRNRLQSYYKKMKNTNYSVKKRQTYFVLFLALLFSGVLNAKVYHNLGASAYGGEWSLLPLQSENKPGLGGAGGVGFVYEMQYDFPYTTARLLVQTGIGFQMGHTSLKASGLLNDTLPTPQQDPQGELFDYVYQLSNCNDSYTSYDAVVPFMVGIQYQKFYALAGFKMHYYVNTTAKSSANILTYASYKRDENGYYKPNGEYPLYPGDPDLGEGNLGHDKTWQFFDDESNDTKAPAKFDMNVDVTLEIGGRFGGATQASGFDVPKRRTEYRLAGFMDFGVTNIFKGGGLDPVEKPKGFTYVRNNDPYSPYLQTYMIDDVTLNPLVGVKGFAKSVHNLTVGIKFTVLFQLPEPKACVVCRDAYRNSTPRFRGGRGMQYEE